jgi:mono/diheme cytochrome c family protein
MTKTSRVALALAAFAAAALLSACTPGAIKREPPLHPNYNMDDFNAMGQRFDAQEANAFFEDGRSMRPRVEGTVPRGTLQEDDHLWRGKDATGAYAKTLPTGMTLDQDLLLRGKDRFEIYCTPCHGVTGAGDGTVAKRGFYPPPSFHDPALRTRDIGYFYEVIAVGVRNMPAYGAQVPVADRWAIAAYVRALQLSHDADLTDIPPAIRQSKGL